MRVAAGPVCTLPGPARQLADRPSCTSD